MAILLCSSGLSFGQSVTSTEPTTGIRDQRPGTVVLEHLTVRVDPQTTLEDVSLLIRDGRILNVGRDIALPAGAKRLDRTGCIAYAGFIDAFSEVELPRPDEAKGGAHWNGNVMPQREAASEAAALPDREKLRSQGITLRVVAPKDGILKGRSCVVLCSDGGSERVLFGETDWQHLTLTVPRGGTRLDRYPNSPMGATALVRQVFYDARWYAAAWGAHDANPELPQPDRNVALESLNKHQANGAFVVDAANERMARRADAISKEFGLRTLLRGSGREYRRLDEIIAGGHPLLVPVDFPDPPKITDAIDAREVSLDTLLDWELAPSNAGRLVDAGAVIALTTDGLSDPGKFLGQVRRAVQAGLDPSDALAALTVVPARLLEIDDVVGTLRSGCIANLVVSDGDLFEDNAKIIETWVDGVRYEVEATKSSLPEKFAGTWKLQGAFEIDEPGEIETLELSFAVKKDKLTGSIAEADETEDAANEEDEAEDTDDTAETEDEEEDEAERVELKSLVLDRNQLVASIKLGELDDDFPVGVSWLTVHFASDADTVQIVDVSVRLPNGTSLAAEMVRAEPSGSGEPAGSGAPASSGAPAGDDKAPDKKDSTEASAAEAERETVGDDQSSDEDESRTGEDESFIVPVLRPLGAYGVVSRPETTSAVVFRGATVWTCDEQGVLEDAEVLIVDGKVAAVGEKLSLPENCRVIEVRGKHITPGLIDCHSHMATDGGVNESGQAVTAEVRIGDFIDNSDITIYRQLAGGLTTSNILHGSANPIGGQNQVIKLRWGATMDEMKFRGAPKGIKFALGENVKRRSGRYPDTRMGVEQIIRDQLFAAREYEAAHSRYAEGDRSMLPPRRNLQLEALAEVLSGSRWIHCHSYRQDEIVALLDTLDEFDVTIGSLQHILEGYKVADRMAEHGATGSSFSDWWAYKFEVYDAIPHNGAIMHEQGIVVSFNSDDAELGRHMNTEAAKAIKYGGVSPEEALKFVTLNPAKQLRIDDRVGSLAAGKDADLVVWSGPPMSTMSRCEQTWIDGRCYFSLEKDAELRKRDAELHAYLVQKTLDKDAKWTGARRERIAEEDRWHRHDIYCLHHDVEEHEEGSHQHAAATGEQQ
jgi:N-acetylglucosamine-6-phosphate deacetylase